MALADIGSLQAGGAPIIIPAFLPPQSQIMSDMVLANNNFTNHWPVPGCASCLPGAHPSTIWTRATYFEGALALYRINQDPNIYNYAAQWGAFRVGRCATATLTIPPMTRMPARSTSSFT